MNRSQSSSSPPSPPYHPLIISSDSPMNDTATKEANEIPLMEMAERQQGRELYNTYCYSTMVRSEETREPN
ncbi:hypothetical protein EYC84_012106 [Monilinia fructicola]|uniref:Uncharacterized protein n=1 Tax=Monilinia fructicola TaxID=38448 RepID=A0A5M9J5Z5_MONFR|nr:hypothetical protein EYC84_012106 [Monilinia fructicola]